jgi:hypothetical protein
MLEYGSNSRYYNCDTEFNIPQDNFVTRNYLYDNATVLANEENRLDLVSFRMYNTPVRWWIIARFNSIINPNYVPAGTVLKIPRL